MDKESLEQRISELLREIEKFNDPDKRKYLSEFIQREIEKDTTTFYIDRYDLTNIESDAISSWSQKSLNRRVGGRPLSTSQIRTLRFFQAVVSCLRKYHVLHRIVDIRFDSEDE